MSPSRLPNDAVCMCTTVQSQNAVSAYISSKKILPFDFAEQSAVQSQKAVSAHFASKQILPFAFAKQYIGHLSSTNGLTYTHLLALPATPPSWSNSCRACFRARNTCVGGVKRNCPVFSRASY